MRILIRASIIAVLLLAFLPSDAKAQRASQDEALLVATSWMARIIGQEEHWGKADKPEILGIQPFTRNGRLLGYFCRVEPVGFIVVSLYKELAPIKAYSTESNLDPDSDEGMVDLLKTKMEGILDALEQPTRQVAMTAAPGMQSGLEIDYRPAWDELLGGQTQTLSFGFQADQTVAIVTQVGPLLSSTWHQGDPYNSFCPEGNSSCIDCCPEDQDPLSFCLPSSRTVVGCVVTAAAQIMKYWNWPPYGMGTHSYYWDGDDSCPSGGSKGMGASTLNATFSDPYDWVQMPDALTSDASQDEINAVAELCYEIGVGQEMNYGVCESASGINYSYITNFRYSPDLMGEKRYDPNRIPNHYSQEEWFHDIRDQLNLNRPIQYVIPGHSVVVDGWLDDTSGKKYHINYGWRDESKTMWYNLDEIDGGKPDEEVMVLNIYPVKVIDKPLRSQWTYVRDPFNYRYFDQNVTGQDVTFAAGQNLQFLPKVKVECNGSSAHDIRFEGGGDTRLYSIKGTQSAGISIHSGAVVLHGNGGIRFH